MTKPEMNAALLIWNPQNRALIEEALAKECRVLPRDRDVFSADIDLLIVDGPALATSREQVRVLKNRAEPLFLPILFISTNPDLTKASPNLWRIIDDVVTRPIVRRELQARVRTLLGARGLSLRLQEALQAERRTNVELRNTRALYEREHLIAETLQRAALPGTLPMVPGFRFDGYYEPAKNDSRIGGDWYDALRVSDGRMVISIGDVDGAGLQAAVTMASVRQAIRAVAQIYPDPVTMLDAADRTLKEEQPGRIVTAFVGVVDPIARTMTYASAGHPPPLLRAPDGSVRELWGQSLPLGIRVRGDGANSVCELTPGAVAVFFTDGLSEVTRNLLEGEARLRQAVQDPAIVRCAHPAAAVKSAVGRDLHSDDVAVLVLSVSETAEPDGVRRWTLHSEDARTAASVRREFLRELHTLGAPPDSLFTCELIFGEMLGNVVRYAPGPLEIVLDARSERAVLHFLDSGKGFTLIPRLPTDLLSERGRGLFLIWTLSEDFNVQVRPQGGAHARALLPIRAALPVRGRDPTQVA